MGRGRRRLAFFANDLGRPALETLGEVTPLHGRLRAAGVGDEADAPSQNQELCCEVGFIEQEKRRGEPAGQPREEACF